MQRTAEILRDIQKLKAHLKTETSPAELSAIREVTETFMEEVAPIAALMALQVTVHKHN